MCNTACTYHVDYDNSVTTGYWFVCKIHRLYMCILCRHYTRCSWVWLLFVDSCFSVLSLWTIYRQYLWNFTIPLPIPAPGCPSNCYCQPNSQGGGLHGSLFHLVETSQIRTSQETVNTANSAAFVGRSKVKKLSASGGLRPPELDPDQGLCPWTLLGAPPPEPRYRLALPHSPWAPHYKIASDAPATK